MEMPEIVLVKLGDDMLTARMRFRRKLPHDCLRPCGR